MFLKSSFRRLTFQWIDFSCWRIFIVGKSGRMEEEGGKSAFSREAWFSSLAEIFPFHFPLSFPLCFHNQLFFMLFFPYSGKTFILELYASTKRRFEQSFIIQSNNTQWFFLPDWFFPNCLLICFAFVF